MINNISNINECCALMSVGFDIIDLIFQTWGTGTKVGVKDKAESVDGSYAIR